MPMPVDTTGYYNKSVDLMNRYKNLNFVRRATTPSLQKMTLPDPDNPKGNYMSHRMSYAEADGQYYAYPEVVQIGNKLQYMPGKKGMEYAFKNKQAIPLGSDKNFADYFTTVGYKYKFSPDIFNEAMRDYSKNTNIMKFIPKNKKGGIYIKPENRDKFTATKKKTGKTTEELTHSKNPLTRKRAIFAQNAKKWNHKKYKGGGPLQNQSNNPMGYRWTGRGPMEKGIDYEVSVPEVVVKGKDYRNYKSAWDGRLSAYSELGDAALRGLNLFSPTTQGRAIYDAVTGARTYGSSISEGNNGIFTDAYAEKHPIGAMVGNMVVDIAVPLKAVTKKGIDLIKYGLKKGTFNPRIGNWSMMLPNLGKETTVYRQGTQEIMDDAIESGFVRPQPHELALKRQEATKMRGIKLSKIFSSNAMFNRKYPFYGNPLPFEKSSSLKQITIVGDIEKNPNVIWKQNFHKNHKFIFEPYMGNELQAPVTDFEIYKRAPYNFGYIKQNISKKYQTGGKYIKLSQPPIMSFEETEAPKWQHFKIEKPFDIKSVLPILDNFEGFEETPYDDGKKHITIGHGLTAKKYINKGKITREESLEGVKEHLNTEVIPRLKKMPYWNNLNNDQKTAISSYVYNVGWGGFTKKSPKLQQALNDGNTREIVKNLDFGYNDPESKGLRERRDYERALFTSQPMLRRKFDPKPISRKKVIDKQFVKKWMK